MRRASMSSAWRKAAFLAAGTLAVSGVAVSTSSAAPRPPAATTNFSTSMAANRAAADLARTLMHDLAASPTYAGLRITPTGIEVDVAGSAATLQPRMAADHSSFAGRAIPVRFRTVRYSQQTLSSLTDQLFSDRAFWRQQGIALSSWGPDIGSNTVAIQLASYTPSAAALIVSHYGSAVSVDPTSQTVAPSASRASDTTPWYGGDLINANGLACTSWFSLQSVTTKLYYNATAGHCGVGDVYVGLTQTTKQGTVPQSLYKWTDGGNTDVEAYNVSSNLGIIWANPTNTIRGVTSRTQSDPVGEFLCTGGAKDNEVCSVEIMRTGQSITYSGKTIKNQVYCQQLNSVPAFSGGDSGGPVYAAQDGSIQAQAFGEIVAYVSTNPGYGWYTPLRYIFAEYPTLTLNPTN